MWQRNAQEVVSQLQSRDRYLLRQIETYIGRFGYEKSAVEDKIMKDPMFAANFSREPRRQGFHETIAAEWLKEQSLDITILPKSGNNALYITRDGMIIKLPEGEQRPSKSLDFCWTYNSITFYAMHKYTKEGGGNQDNQFKEMVGLLHSFLGASNPSNALIVIVDGPYYTERRMCELISQTRTNPPMSFATPIQGVPAILEEYFSKKGV